MHHIKSYKIIFHKHLGTMSYDRIVTLKTNRFMSRSFWHEHQEGLLEGNVWNQMQILFTIVPDSQDFTTLQMTDTVGWAKHLLSIFLKVDYNFNPGLNLD